MPRSKRKENPNLVTRTDDYDESFTREVNIGEVKVELPPLDGWVLEYETPRGNNARRVAFYRAVRKLQWEYIRKEEFASHSSYFTDNGEFAKKFYELVRRFDKKARAYAVVRVK